MAYSGGTIVNPTIPYNCPIPGGLQNGKMVVIQGTCNHRSTYFSINLSLSPQMNPLGDVALHFNPRFNESVVVRNHHQHGGWGSEERGGGFPFKKGTPFEIIILADSHHYKVSVNGVHFCNFNHRLPKESVQYLVLCGEVNISYVKFQGGATPAPMPGYPPAQPVYNPTPAPAPGFPPPYNPVPVPGYPPIYNPTPAPAPGYPPAYNPPTPYTASIPGGLFPGRMIYISGVPNPSVSRFTVNLMCGPSEQGDIAFTFDARFNFGGVYNQTVRNHKVGSVWGTEERHQTHFPFTSNVNFDMIILIEPTAIKVAVNNQHFTEFNHRLQPISRVDFLNISGDVRLTSVRIQ